jgi:hypothetical protein
MKKFNKIVTAISLVAGLLFSFNSSATTPSGTGQEWHGPFTIKKLARYWDGGQKTTVHVNEKMNTLCATSDQEGKVTYYYGNNYEMNNTLTSLLMAAQAQNKKIMLLIDRDCHSTYGKNLHGVEILSN